MKTQNNMENFQSLTDAASEVLRESDPLTKVQLSLAAASAWHSRKIMKIGDATPPSRPARPARPELMDPTQMVRRRINRGVKGRKALLHSLAHIELNAIDLAWDLIARFVDRTLPYEFYDDWCRVAAQEAEHFVALNNRLTEIGGDYGELPAHDGLWEIATKTKHDLVARLAVVPLVLEARGLDVTPGIIKKLNEAEDDVSANILQGIYEDEITHVAAGRRWFDYACAARGLEPVSTWHAMVRDHFKGRIKGPLNHAARNTAGFLKRYYMPLATK